jgi:hypothetical protein
MPLAPTAAPALDGVPARAVDRLALALVDGGRFLPGLEMDSASERARGVWWPMPAARDRTALLALAGDGSADAHVRAALALGEAVDSEVRRRLAEATGEGAPFGPPTGRGRPSAPGAWWRALTGPDPWLPSGVATTALMDLAEQLRAWAAEGVADMGRSRLCLMVREPDILGDDPAAPWSVDLLLQDVDESSLLVPAAEVWAGTSPFGPTAVHTLLVGLARAVRLAPELAPALDEAEPASLDLDGDAVLRLVRERSGSLADAGFGVLLPSWWGRRRRVGLRAKARSGRTASGASGGVAGGVGLDAIVSFEWEAVLGDTELSKAEVRTLQQAAASKRSLVRLRGEWVELRPGEIEELLRHAGQQAEARAMDLLRAAVGLADPDALGLPDGLDVEGVTSTGWLGRLLDEAREGSARTVVAPTGFAGTLRPYQQRGVGWLTFLGRIGMGACLADDMGLGKTAQLIASLLEDRVTDPTLVVCPVSVLGNWERELERFAPGLRVLVHHGPRRLDGDEALATTAARHDVVLTTYSLVARDRDVLATVPWGRVVLDEAQQIKNPGTSQARAVRAIPADRRVALTGTPVENRLSELWSVMQFLNPGLLGSASSFRDRFASPIEKDGDEEAAALLRRVTGPFVLRRLKSDRSIIDDLPDKIEVVERCVLTKEQASLYQAVVDDLLEKASSTEGIERRGLVLAGLMQLKQVCNHPAHFLHDGSALHGRSGKLTRVEELLDELLDAGDRVLCFTQFAEWGTLLQPYLASRYDEEVLWLHGGVRRSVRDQQVERFQSAGGPRMMLVSLKAGGTGLNLTAASHVIHLDRWWNPAVEDQATDRAYRIGQKRSVLVHKPVCTGTVEERIDAMISAKRALAEKVVGTGEDMLTGLSTDDLRAVVALGTGAVED